MLLSLFSCSVMSDSLRPYGLQHTSLPCPSLSLEFAQIHVQIVGDAIQPSPPLPPPSPPALSLSQHQGILASCGQSIGASVSSFVLPVSIQDCFPFGLTCLILLFKSHNSKASLLWYSVPWSAAILVTIQSVSLTLLWE